MILVKKIQIPTEPTEKPRRLYVYLPRGYETGEKRYPVLYMFDGHNVFYNSHATYGKCWGMKEYLEKSRREVIVVGVECNHEGDKRLHEYSPWDFRSKRFGAGEGLGKVTMDWFTSELKPEIDREYRTLPAREHTMIAGSSMGGIMALYALLAYNDVFSKAAALSPSLWVDPKALKTLIKTAPLQNPTQLYMDCGSGEARGRVKQLAPMFRVSEELTKRGAFVAVRSVPYAMHNEAAWEKRIPVFFDFFDEGEQA